MNYLEHLIKVRSNDVPKIRYYVCTANPNQNTQLYILDILMRAILWKARGLPESAQNILFWVTQKYKAPQCFAHNTYGTLHTNHVNSCVATT
jgi:hypothetical protein